MRMPIEVIMILVFSGIGIFLLFLSNKKKQIKCSHSKNIEETHYIYMDRKMIAFRCLNCGRFLSERII